MATLALAAPSAALASGAGTPSSHATPAVDVRSDHAALAAFRTYLQGLLADAPAWSQADDAYVASVSASCPNVLAAVNLLPPSSMSKSALQAFGEEMATDLVVASNAPDRARLARLTRALTRLRWTHRSARAVVRRFLSAQGRLDGLAPSTLCSDAQVLADTDARTTPPDTLLWLATFGRANSAAGSATRRFAGLLRRLAGPADRSVIDSIGRLAGRLDKAGSAVFDAEWSKLASALGLAS